MGPVFHAIFILHTPFFFHTISFTILNLFTNFHTLTPIFHPSIPFFSSFSTILSIFCQSFLLFFTGIFRIFHFFFFHLISYTMLHLFTNFHTPTPIFHPFIPVFSLFLLISSPPPFVITFCPIITGIFTF